MPAGFLQDSKDKELITIKTFMLTFPYAKHNAHSRSSWPPPIPSRSILYPVQNPVAGAITCTLGLSTYWYLGHNVLWWGLVSVRVE